MSVALNFEIFPFPNILLSYWPVFCLHYVNSLPKHSQILIPLLYTSTYRSSQKIADWSTFSPVSFPRELSPSSCAILLKSQVNIFTFQKTINCSFQFLVLHTIESCVYIYNNNPTKRFFFLSINTLINKNSIFLPLTSALSIYA